MNQILLIMNDFFAAFIILALMLEIFKLNRLRILAIKENKPVPVLTTIISSAIIYGLFIMAGYYAEGLLPDFIPAIDKIISVIVLGVMIAYVLLRDRRYNKAGKLVYSNFNLFLLIVVGRSLVHLMTGLLLALLDTNMIWIIQSYGLGIILFGIGAIMAKGEYVRIFGISVEYIKILSYVVAAFLILLN